MPSNTVPTEEDRDKIFKAGYTEAYEKGYAAARYGKPMSANPYNKVTQVVAYSDWDDAWMVCTSKEAKIFNGLVQDPYNHPPKRSNTNVS